MCVLGLEVLVQEHLLQEHTGNSVCSCPSESCPRKGRNKRLQHFESTIDAQTTFHITRTDCGSWLEQS
eukprot:235173-Amphidinium_carterae.1